MEKVVELVHKNDREIGQLTQALGDLKEGVVEVKNSIDKHHVEESVVREENRGRILAIQESVQDLNNKVGIQNGKVFKNQSEIVDLQKGMADMMRLISRHDGEITRRNKTDEETHNQKILKGNKYVELKYTLWTKIGYVIIGIVGYWLTQSLFPSISPEIIPNIFK